VARQLLTALLGFLSWFFSAWWELLLRNRELLNSRDRAAWIISNVEAVTVLVITVLFVILLVIVIDDPRVVFLFKNPKTEPIWNIG
jgi:hypothetical protein